MRTPAYSRILSAMIALALALPLGGGLLTIPVAHADYAQCSDGIDNDSDGQIDYPEDANCESIYDNSEWADNGVFVTVSDERDEIAPGASVTRNATGIVTRVCTVMPRFSGLRTVTRYSSTSPGCA